VYHFLPVVWLLGGWLGAMGGWGANKSFMAGHGPASIPDSKTFFEWTLMYGAMATMYYFISRMWEIATPFHMALPIEARDLWRARIIVMLTAVIGGAGIFCGSFWLVYDQPIHEIQRALAFNAISFAVLIPFLYHSARIRTGTWGMPLPIFLLLLVGITYAYTRIGMRTLAPGLISLAVAVVLGVRSYRSLPKSFGLHVETSGLRNGIERGVAFCFAWMDKVPFLHSFVEMDRILRPSVWFTRLQQTLILSIIFLLSLSVFTRSLHGVVLACVIVQGALFARTVNGEARAAHLPIPRDRVFRHATLPSYLYLGAALALVVTLLPQLSWGGVLPDPSVALGVVFYALTWYFVLSLFLVGRATPPPTRRAWRRRLFARLHTWIALSLILVLVIYDVRLGLGLRLGEGSATRSLLRVLGDLTPLSAALLWMVAAACVLSAYFGLRRGFLRTETAILGRGPVT
jgi:hypothetical protein